MIVTFCGHREVWEAERVRDWLSQNVESLILRGADKFYLGGYGAFDRMAASVVREQKRKYPDIVSVLVLAYLDRKADSGGYDYTTYPPLESVPRRYAIPRRNQWMVRESDVLVACVLHDWGGAAATLEYARRRKKEIIRLEKF